MKNIFSKNLFIPQYNAKGVFLRQVKSFKLRTRPIKKTLLYILKTCWCNFGLDFQHQFLNFNDIFHKEKAPIILEIGFGSGKNLLYTAFHNQNYNIVGIEVYIPGIAKVIKKINCLKDKINNIKIIAHDATEVLQFMIPHNTIHIIQLFFPDPWPKTRHHKRRILQKTFIMLLAQKLIHNGILHIITDCHVYAQYIINLMDRMNYFINLSNFFHSSMLSYIIQMTQFGKKASLNKKKIFNLIFQCKKCK